MSMVYCATREAREATAFSFERTGKGAEGAGEEMKG